MSDRPIIIIKKKKIIAAARHGGSWKVAYADFVTAMMAFFMVMWIMGMDEGVKDVVEGYFSNPVGFKKGFSGGANILAQGNSITSFEMRQEFLIKRRAEEKSFQEAIEDIEAKLKDTGLVEGAEAVVEAVVTEHGLRIEMMESGEGETFFDKSSAELKPQLRSVLMLIASELADLPNGLIVEGHTDALAFARDGYSNWDLSTDRANAAIRMLEEGGLPTERILEIRGLADRELKVVEDPLDPRNRRISLLLPFDSPDVDILELDSAALDQGFGSASEGTSNQRSGSLSSAGGGA